MKERRRFKPFLDVDTHGRYFVTRDGLAFEDMRNFRRSPLYSSLAIRSETKAFFLRQHRYLDARPFALPEDFAERATRRLRLNSELRYIEWRKFLSEPHFEVPKRVVAIFKPVGVGKAVVR